MNTWKKPKLIALVRGRPEERVLDGCKTAGLEGQGPTSNHLQCVEEIGIECLMCDSSNVS
jgi:hypothetical protein